VSDPGAYKPSSFPVLEDVRIGIMCWHDEPTLVGSQCVPTVARSGSQ
jgi:hypothetical protein